MAEPSERHMEEARDLLGDLNNWERPAVRSHAEIDQETVAKALDAAKRRGAEAGYDAGWEASAQGWNAEHPGNAEVSEDWCAKKRSAIARIVGSTPDPAPAADVRAAALNVLANLSADDPHHLTREQLIYKIACSTRLLNRVLGRRLVERGGRDDG